MKDEAFLVDVAKLIGKHEISISEFYSRLGIDLDDVSHSDPSYEVASLAGIFTGWNNPPGSEDA